MPLMRKTRLSGSSIVLTIPSQIAEAYDIVDGDSLEIVPINQGEMILKKVKKLS